MEATLSKAEYDAIISQKDAKIDALESRLRQLEKLLFGAKSERTKTTLSPEQLALWDGGADAGAQSVEKAKITYERKKKSTRTTQRNDFPDHLPVDEVVLNPSEDTTGMVRIGEEITETLDYQAASLRIKRVIRPKYARPEAEQEQGESPVVIAPLPSRPIERGTAEASLLAHVFVAKFVDHQPFYRQIKAFRRDYGWHAARLHISPALTPLFHSIAPPVDNVRYKEVLR